MRRDNNWRQTALRESADRTRAGSGVALRKVHSRVVCVNTRRARGKTEERSKEKARNRGRTGHTAICRDVRKRVRGDKRDTRHADGERDNGPERWLGIWQGRMRHFIQRQRQGDAEYATKMELLGSRGSINATSCRQQAARRRMEKES